MPAAPKRRAERNRSSGFAWRWPALWFAIGLLCRLAAFQIPHDEGDEIVYRALVHQLEDGRGYTLRGTALIDHGWPADQYGHALFFHPPGGIAAFWLLDAMFGDSGLPLAQVLSYAIFFWSLIALARLLYPPLAGLRLQVVALLAAFTPLMTHVTARYWLDAPMLAFVTLGAAMYVRAVGGAGAGARAPGAERGAAGAGADRAAGAAGAARGAAGAERSATRWAIAAGLALGYASWIKIAALVALPAILLLGWAIAEPATRRDMLRRSAIFAAVALAVQVPWEIWQWAVLGSPFPAWAGRPSPQLVTGNAYVRFLTVDRPAWIYLTLMPRAVWTLVPSVVCLAAAPLDPRARRLGVALVAWIALVLAVVIGLGTIGYSKLLRYAILVTPATVLLFALVGGEIGKALRDPALPAGQRARVRFLAAIAAAGFALEIAQGIYTPLIDRRDIIWPLLMRGHGLR